MYYDIEEETRFQEPDIDEELKKLRERKYLVEKEYNSSEKSSEDKIKYYYSLLAIEENKNKLLDKKYWKEYSRSASLSADVENLRESSVYDFSKLLFYYLLSGFLISCAKYGVPSDLWGIIFSVVFSPFFGLYTIFPLILLSKGGGSFGKSPRIFAVIFFIIYVIIILIAFNQR